MSDQRQRDHTIGVRVTPEELIDLRAAAAKDRKSVAAFLRETVLEVIEYQELAERVREVS
jgi:hypothetical protein